MWYVYTTEYYMAMLLLLLLSRFIRVRLCATPETEAYQAPPSLGFSRQEGSRGTPWKAQSSQGVGVNMRAEETESGKMRLSSREGLVMSAGRKSLQ